MEKLVLEEDLDTRTVAVAMDTVLRERVRLATCPKVDPWERVERIAPSFHGPVIAQYGKQEKGQMDGWAGGRQIRPWKAGPSGRGPNPLGCLGGMNTRAAEVQSNAPPDRGPRTMVEVERSF